MAEMWTVIIKNYDSTAEILIEDLGIPIPASGQVEISNEATYPEIAGSDDLRDLVRNETLVVNDGTDDLSATKGVKWLTIRNLVDEKGQNDPVRARVLAIQSAQPAGTTEGDFYVDTDDDHLYKFISSSWVDQGAIEDSWRFINLDSTSQNIFEYSSTTDNYDDQGQPTDGATVVVLDNGDGNQAIWGYDLSGLEWVILADYDFVPPTLDEAYDAQSPGGGRIIYTDSGSVKLDSLAATSAPFEVVPKASLPSTSLADGQIANKNGILCVYDGTRSKWLSLQRMFLVFGRKGLTKNQWINFCAGTLPSNNGGYRVVRDATIVSVSGQFDAVGTGTFNVRKNDVSTNILNLTLTGVTGAGSTASDVDLTAGDFLQCRVAADVSVEDPMIVVEIAWRP